MFNLNWKQYKHISANTQFFPVPFTEQALSDLKQREPTEADSELCALLLSGSGHKRRAKAVFSALVERLTDCHRSTHMAGGLWMHLGQVRHRKKNANNTLIRLEACLESPLWCLAETKAVCLAICRLRSGRGMRNPAIRISS